MPYFLFRLATFPGGQYWRRLPGASKSRTIQGCAALDDEPRNSSGTWPQDSADITCIIDSTRVSSLGFLADGRLMMSSSRDNNYRILIWVAEHGRLEEMDSPTEHEEGAEGVAITAVVACGDGGRYLISGDEHGKLIFWEDLKTSIRKVKELRVSNSKITALDVCADSLRAVSGSEDGQVVVWCTQTKERLVGPLRNENSSAVLSVKFSPMGDRIASAHDLVRLDASSIRIWHSSTGAQLWSVPMTSLAYSLAWSANGRRLFAGASFGSIKYFDVVTQSLLAEWQAPYRDLITTLCTALKDRLLVSVSSGRSSGIDIWDISDTFPPTLLRSRDGVRLAAISQDDACLATIEEKNKFGMWKLSSVMDGFYPYCRLPPFTEQGEPFTYVSNAVYGAWKSGDLELVEKTLSKELEEHTSRRLISYHYANRALVRIRRKSWDGALRDANAAMSNDGPIPMIAYIAKGLSIYREGQETMCAATLDVFESALRSCDANDIKDFIRSIKDIALSDDNFIALSDTSLYRLVRMQARKLFLRASSYKDTEDFERAMELLVGIPDLGPLLHTPEVKTISLIFGWDIYGLISDIHKLRCRALFKLKSNCFLKAINYFSAAENDLSEVLESMTAKLSSLSEEFGDKASLCGWHDEAFAWYSEALALAGCPSDIVKGPMVGNRVVTSDDQAVSQCLVSLRRHHKCIAHLLANRSEIKARLGLWEDALTDAEWAIQADASHFPGHHRKYVALHAMGRYKETYATLSDLSSHIKDSEEDELNRSYLRTLFEINKAIEQVFNESPFILIDVKDGHLCDQKEQRRRFETDSTFFELVSSTVSSILQAKAPETAEIKKVVRKYFLYVMLSHTWEDQEPLFHDVSEASVYDTSFMKLVNFCEMVRDNYEQYRWSWNDTCCINKMDKDKYQKSISSMYKWYGNSALTLVLLSDPSQNPIGPSNNPTSSLPHNRWMFRAWTLQELLAPKVIRFYYRTWKLYLGDEHFNHKDSPRIKSELVKATGIEEDTLVHFSPEGLPVREKLRVASSRKASMDVDIAYSLMGIFRSDIIPDYNRHDAETALGLLLQEIVQRRGDITVLDWFGKPSGFHSSLPADISVYGQTPYKLPSITDDELDGRVKELSRTLPEQEVTHFYNKLVSLDPPAFDNRKLKLPCITISVTDVTSRSATPPVYVASTAALGTFEFSAENAPSFGWCQEDVVLVYPWIFELVREINRREGNEYTKALRVVAYLERGFRALLFAKRLHTRERVGYRRVAAEQHIDIPARALICWKGVAAKSLEVFD